MKLGLLGGGKMGGALLEGMLRRSAVTAADCALCESDAARRETLARSLELGFTGTAAEVAARSRVLLVAVKPAQVAAVLASVRPALTSAHVVVSVAAGVTLAKLREAAGDGPAVVRVMPNTPALVGQGVSALCFEPDASDALRAEITALFAAAGAVVEVAEKDMDAVTGLSGSGPAYVFLFLEALADGGVRAGLSREAAMQLAVETVRGAAALAALTKTHPAVLKDQVASPGGTTIAGIEALEANGFRHAVIQAVNAAAKRSAELTK